jgi:hypothetical protein
VPTSSARDDPGNGTPAECPLGASQAQLARQGVIGDPPRERVEAATVIDQFENRPLADAISRIVVPEEALEAARKIFGNKVVSMEGIQRALWAKRAKCIFEKIWPWSLT